MERVIVMHGGADNDFDDRVGEFRAGIERATKAGWDVLRQDGPAMVAVEAAARVLEDDPNINAGHC
jgi:isoaspartyl peptidase/L-asparaginase-like protein (Ntn-hydrolase superfamily)